MRRGGDAGTVGPFSTYLQILPGKPKHSAGAAGSSPDFLDETFQGRQASGGVGHLHVADHFLNL